MKRKEFFMIAGICLALVIACTLALQAGQLWEERAELVSLRQEQEELIKSSRSFALEHSNYEVYAARQQQKILFLEKQVHAAQNVNGAVQKLQRSAKAQGLKLSSVELAAKEAAKNKTSMQLQPVKLSMSGEFFSVLRWLRAVERDGFSIGSVHMSAAENLAQNVQLELLIKLHTVNL